MYAHGYRASYGNVLGARATVIAVAVEVVAARVRALLAPAQICVPPCCAGDCEGCEHAKEDSHAPCWVTRSKEGRPPQNLERFLRMVDPHSIGISDPISGFCLTQADEGAAPSRCEKEGLFSPSRHDGRLCRRRGPR